MELSTQIAIAMHLTNVRRDEPAPLLFAHQSVMGDGSALATQSECKHPVIILNYIETLLELLSRAASCHCTFQPPFVSQKTLSRETNYLATDFRALKFSDARATPRLINPSY